MTSINVTPLTDVLLVLLITFLLTASSFQEASTELPLPRVAEAQELSQSMERVGLGLDGQPDWAIPELAGEDPEAAFERLRQLSDKPILALAVHRDLPYRKLYPLLVAAQEAGWTRIVLLTEVSR